MKKLIALLLAAGMCLSLTSCVTSSNKALISGYESRIAELEEIIREYEKAQNTGSGNENTESPGTDPQETEPRETEPKKNKTIELTLDNWKDYFEIRPTTDGPVYSSFGDFERLSYINWAMFLKDDIADKVISLDDAAIEYSFRDGYFCWFEYNFDTGVLSQKDAATDEEVGGDWRKVEDASRQTNIWKQDDGRGSFLVFIQDNISETLNGNIYSFIGQAYGTMEIIRIKGTITISE